MQEEKDESLGSNGDEFDEDDIEIIATDETGQEIDAGQEDDSCAEPDDEPEAKCEADEVRNEYVRLYAEFENYKKRMARDKEELAKYANESMLLELLPSMDNMEIALKHIRNEAEKYDSHEPLDKLIEGVDMTMREIYRTLEKFGLKHIEALHMPFDPVVHHAIAQMERDDMDPGMVVAEMRKGFMYKDRVLRASMVSVSKKPESSDGDQ